LRASFSEVKHARLFRLGEDTVKAAGEVRDARQRAKPAIYKRRHGYTDDNNKWDKPVPRRHVGL